MGKRGPKATPTDILTMRGSWRAKKRLAEGEPEPAKGRPACPEWMPAEGKREWRRIVKELEAMGILHKCDRSALVAYAEAWAHFVAAAKTLAEEGLLVTLPSGIKQQNPAVAIKNKASERLEKLAAQFGLTPASRANVKKDKGQDAAKPQGKARFFKAG